MRWCVDRERMPIGVKWGYITICQQVMKTLDDDTDVLISDYGTRFTGGATGSSLGSLLQYRGVFEPVLSELVLSHVRPGDVCVDAGANVGYFTLLMARAAGPSGEVIAIEAAPGNVRRLHENLAANGVTDQVRVVEAACAAETGELTFYLHPGNDMWARLTPPAKGEFDRLYMGKKWNPVVVKAATPSELVGDAAERTSFLKLDIEGAEPSVTPDIVAAFTHPRLVVALEAKAPHVAETLAPFRDAGFRPYDLHNDYRWAFERRVPPITAASYDDFAEFPMADVLVSREPLDLP
jgi:FkbM family methyltransferase